MMYRTKFIDYEARRQPKTARFCVRCQRDIKPESTARVVHVVNECYVLHPEDEQKFQGPDNGLHLLGMDCARTIGLEWTRKEGTHPDEGGRG